MMREQSPFRPTSQHRNSGFLAGMPEVRNIVTVEEAVTEGLPDVFAGMLSNAREVPPHLRRFVQDNRRFGETRYSWKGVARAVELSILAQCATSAQIFPEYLRSLILARHAQRVSMPRELLAAFLMEDESNAVQNRATIHFHHQPHKRTKDELIYATRKQSDASRHLCDVLHDTEVPS